MLTYYFKLAARSIRANWLVSTLMILAVGVGIGACMTIVTVNYLMGKDPIPTKSGQLFAVQLDSWSPDEPANDDGSPPDQLTYMDAAGLLQAAAAPRQVAMMQTAFVLQPDDAQTRPFPLTGRAASADFFSMFDVPFLYGQPWDADTEAAGQQVAVLTRESNEKIFGGVDSVGRTIRLSGRVFTVVGVLDTWRPMPRYYDVTNAPFAEPEEVMVPFTLHRTLQLPRRGNTNCWQPVADEDADAIYRSECVFTQFWAELPTTQARQAYAAFLDGYVDAQKASGRFARPLNNRLSDVNQWLKDQKVVDENARMMLGVAVMFLVVCLLNTIGLLLAKFIGKAPEIGLRRALGASRSTLFAQYLVESVAVGALGGLLGLLLTWLGLLGVEMLFGNLVRGLVRLDGVMVGTALALAVFASVLAGVYPTWRACSVQPAAQLKSQ